MSDKEAQAEALIKPASIKYDAGEYEKVIEICNEANSIDPFVIGPYYYKALALIGLDRFEDALLVLKEATEYFEDFEKEKDPYNKKYVRQICYARGVALFYLKRYDEAIKDFDYVQSLQLDTGMRWNITFEACNQVGRCHYMMGNYPEALQWFEKSCGMDRMGNYYEPVFNMALTYQKMRDFDKALEKVEKCLNYYKNNPLYWNTKGLILLEQGKDKFAARAFEKAEEYIAQGVHIEGQTRSEESEMQKAAQENRKKLLGKIPRFTQITFTDPDLKKQRDEILKETTQALQDNANNAQVEALLKRMEELEKKNAALTYEVAEVKIVGDFEETKKIKQEMEEIKDSERLYNYYKSFNSLFSRTYIGYLSVASGLVTMEDQTPTPLSLLTTVGQKVPMFGEIFSFLQQGISKVYEIKTTNESTRMAQLAKNTTEMDRIVDNVSRAITLDAEKKQEIKTIQEKKKNSFVKFFEQIKSKVYVDEFNTPEKQLALKDATILIMACAAGQVSSEQLPEKIEKEMVGLIIKGKFEEGVLDECQSCDKASKNKSSGTAKISPDGSSTTEGESPKKVQDVDKTACCNIF